MIVLLVGACPTLVAQTASLSQLKESLKTQRKINKRTDKIKSLLGSEAENFDSRSQERAKKQMRKLKNTPDKLKEEILNSAQDKWKSIIDQASTASPAELAQLREQADKLVSDQQRQEQRLRDQIQERQSLPKPRPLKNQSRSENADGQMTLKLFTETSANTAFCYNDLLTLSYEFVPGAHKPTTGSLQILSTTMIAVSQPLEITLDPGTNIWTIDYNLPSGDYFLRWTYGQETISKKSRGYESPSSHSHFRSELHSR